MSIYGRIPVGFSGWGGGQGPQGLGGSPGLPGAAPGVKSKPGQHVGRTINVAYYVIIGATGVPQRAPGVAVAPGCQVLVRAHNGVTAGNTNPVLIDHQPEMAGTGDPITPDSEITWPTDNTIDMWIMGTKGDGVRVSIQQQR